MRIFLKFLPSVLFFSFAITACGNLENNYQVPTITPVLTTISSKIAVSNLKTEITPDGVTRTTANLSLSPTEKRNLEVVAPSNMLLGETRTIKLTITPENFLLRTSTPTPRSTAQPLLVIQATQQAIDKMYPPPPMIAELQSPNFRILPNTATQRLIRADSIVEWWWAITSFSTGKQILLLSLSTPATNGTIEAKLSLEITVQPNGTITIAPIKSPIATSLPTATLQSSNEQIIQNPSIEGYDMSNIIPLSALQIGLFIFISWVLIGIAGYEIFAKYLAQLSDAFDNTFEIFSTATKRLADSLIRYFHATDIEIAQRINLNWNQSASEVIANDIEQNDKPILANRIKIEKMTGAIIGLFSLIAVFYGNTLLGIASLFVLFPPDTIPTFLNIPISSQLIIIIVGLVTSNGLYVSDILGSSHYTNSTRLWREGKQINLTEKFILGVRVFNLILTIIIFIFMAINNTTISSVAFSLLIIPLLLTASTSLNSISGMYLILSLPLYLFSISAFLLRYILQFSIGVFRAYINILWILFDNMFGKLLKGNRDK